MKRWAWGIVALLTIVRLAAAYILPFTGDEAYYWEWSQHLALGYTDHPGGVAWTVASTHVLGSVPGTIRLGFWLCGVIATWAMADCTARLARSRGADAGYAAAIAAVLTTVAPIIAIAFGIVSPDGPFLASWALTLDAAMVLMLRPTMLAAIATGCAIGIGLESRAFAVALLVGVLCALRNDRRSCGIVMGVACIWSLPLLWWNATHAWQTIIFTLVGRHVDEGFSLLRPPVMFAESLLAFGIGPAIAVIWGGGLGLRRNVSALLLWTSLPLIVVLFLLSLMERVETYWFLGPYLSLTVAAAISIAEGRFARKRSSQIAIIVPPIFLLTLLYLLVFTVIPMSTFAAQRYHIRLHKALLFNIYALDDLARDVKSLAATRHALVMTDGYGLSSLLDYYGSITPLVIGYSWQGREARNWSADAPEHTNALFVDLESLNNRPDFAQQLAKACRRVLAGPSMQYTRGELPLIVFPTTWCLDMKPHAIAILRWEQTR